MDEVSGNYYPAAQSIALRATAFESPDGGLRIKCQNTQQTLQNSAHGAHRFGMVLSGIPTEVNFADGALFEPDDHTFQWRTANNKKESLVAKLETHWGMVALAVIVIPAFMYWVIMIALPNAAEKAVDVLPHTVFVQAEKQSLAILERTVFDPSRLPSDAQQRIRQDWKTALETLSLAPDDYELVFRYSAPLGANAFALPAGKVVITDDLVTALDDNADALLAVLLHEIGHVEHQHGMKMVARAAATSIFFALMLGDIDGVGEYVIGASSSLLNNAFSRDMEREADSFAIRQLQALGKSPTAFADAMTVFLSNDDKEQTSKNNVLLHYLSSHPNTLERIEAANAAANTP